MKKVEWVSYWPTSRDISERDVINALPPRLKQSLFKNWLGAEINRSDVILELDERFQIGKTKEYVKTHRLEIHRSCISDYSHFIISPRILEANEHVFFQVTHPTCDVDTRKTGSGMVCPWGSRIISPILILQKCLKNLDLAQICRVWDFQAKELVMSPAMKEIFDTEGITSLDYEECWTTEKPGPSVGRRPPAYVARVSRGGYQSGDDIIVGRDYCLKHSIVLTPYIFGERTPQEGLGQDDFQRLGEVRIGNKEYHHYKSHLVITRRALELLLKHRVRGLRPATVILTQPFRPLIVS